MTVFLAHNLKQRAYYHPQLDKTSVNKPLTNAGP